MAATQRCGVAAVFGKPLELDPGLLPDSRAENVHGLRWWTADEIRAAGIETVPRDLA